MFYVLSPIAAALFSWVFRFRGCGLPLFHTDRTLSGKNPFMMLQWECVCPCFSSMALCVSSRCWSNIVYTWNVHFQIHWEHVCMCCTSFWPLLLAASLYPYFLCRDLPHHPSSPSPLQTTVRYVFGRTLPTRRTRRWWRRGRASPTCCPPPEVSPAPAPTVKINALFYRLPPSHTIYLPTVTCPLFSPHSHTCIAAHT